ncbi:class I SAM-dependent methyltransferase [Uliginosibacterium sp. 31-12]|uniref:class I SAM-dependent methyltransferase n=1 Tax=Uliginosibacterium sp. 31-12 TaxID=3062781 RepID=UPI0026E1F1E9|nr:class I SAM-dependent methyltransferase [Uliginosibacterium sp. 31-12]MDO6384986.1 class I SAM-dependent methyltransferase [Uliginosibacterium sp. 31-12]
MTGAPAGAQYYPEESEFAVDCGVNLKLCACPVCNLYQLDNDPVAYYRDVIRSGGYSATAVELRRRQYSEMMRRFNISGKRVFECGCGRGEFLSVWKEFSVEAVGVENSKLLVDEALANGLCVERGFIGSSTDGLRAGRFDAFTSFNFLEHQPDPSGMLQGIFNNLTDDGVGLVTVPGWEYIHKRQAYYELIVDHLVYFTRDTFEKILNRNGFVVEAWDESLEDTHAAFVRRVRTLLDVGLERAEGQLSAKLKGFVRANQKSHGHIVVWGASHQGFTILACAGIAHLVDYIVDSAIFKQGRYSPGSHLEIKNPSVLADDDVSALVVIAPNYADEIIKIIVENYGLKCPVAVVRDGDVEIYDKSLSA